MADLINARFFSKQENLCRKIIFVLHHLNCMFTQWFGSIFTPLANAELDARVTFPCQRMLDKGSFE